MRGARAAGGRGQHGHVRRVERGRGRINSAASERDRMATGHFSAAPVRDRPFFGPRPASLDRSVLDVVSAMTHAFEDEELPLPLLRRAAPKPATEAEDDIPMRRDYRATRGDRLQPATAGALAGALAGAAAPRRRPRPPSGAPSWPGSRASAPAGRSRPTRRIPLAYLAAGLGGAVVGAVFASTTRHLRRSFLALLVWALVFFVSLDDARARGLERLRARARRAHGAGHPPRERGLCVRRVVPAPAPSSRLIQSGREGRTQPLDALQQPRLRHLPVRHLRGVLGAAPPIVPAPAVPDGRELPVLLRRHVRAREGAGGPARPARLDVLCVAIIFVGSSLDYYVGRRLGRTREPARAQGAAARLGRLLPGRSLGLQVLQLRGRLVRDGDGLGRAPRLADAPAPRAAVRHLVLHVRDDELHDRRLPPRDPAGRSLPRLPALRLLLPAPRRGADRAPEVDAPAAPRRAGRRPTR